MTATTANRRLPTAHLICWLFIGAGILLRLIIFFQNRNLIIDEANIVRNLAERGFAGLTQPLKYEQYAPPVFLWIEKVISLIAGYGEKSMRLYSLLCGIGALLMFYKVGARIMRPAVLIFPLALFSFSHIFIEYSACVKQYMPDILIALTLVWCALQWDIRRLRPQLFALRWMIVGSIAIWASMPSVFILAGVGACYAWVAFQESLKMRWLPLIAIGAVWLAQFGLYYFTMLKAQIGSEYLQGYHHDYFLIALPKSGADWSHNWTRIEALLGVIGGWQGMAVVFNLGLLILGAWTLLRKKRDTACLILFPIVLVLVAAAAQQYSLIERVVLFMLPLWLLVIGFGFDVLWGNERHRKGEGFWEWALTLRPLLVLVSAYVVLKNCDFRLLMRRYTFHEITTGLDYVNAHRGHGSRLYVHHASVPTYRYYTELHPDKEKWAALDSAHLLEWGDNYGLVGQNIHDTAYFIYTGGFDVDERVKRTSEANQTLRETGVYEAPGCVVFVYVPKAAALTTASGTTPN